MKTELRNRIFKKIKDRNLRAFSCFDFTDLAPYKAVSKCLERLEDSQDIRRIIQGIYCLNLIDRDLQLPILPSIDEVVECLARKNKWIISPTGNTALNLMSMSTQVPAIYEYLSTGPYKEYVIYGIHVHLKRTMARELIDYSKKTLLLIQCIKAIGKENFDFDDVAALSLRLDKNEKKRALAETSGIQAWIRKIIVTICKE